MKSRPITEKQESFCQEYLRNGGNKTAAYKHAYSTSKMKEKTINEKACVLYTDDKVSERMLELRERIANSRIMNAQEIQEFWTDTIRDSEQEMKDRIKCTDLLGKCIGIFEKDNKQKNDVQVNYYAPKKNKDN